MKRVAISLTDVLGRFVPLDERLKVSLGAYGDLRCRVCGRKHRGMNGWKRCASTRANRDISRDFPLSSKRVYHLNETLAYEFFLWLGLSPQIVTEEPNPIIACLVPEEDLPKAEDYLRELISRISEELSRQFEDYVKEEIGKRTRRGNVLKSLESGLLDDAVGYYLIEVMSRDLFIVRHPFTDPLLLEKMGNPDEEVTEGWKLNKKSPFFKEWNIDPESLRGKKSSRWVKLFLEWVISKLSGEGIESLKGSPLLGFKLLWWKNDILISILTNGRWGEGVVGVPTFLPSSYLVVIDLKDFTLKRLISNLNIDLLKIATKHVLEGYLSSFIGDNR